MPAEDLNKQNQATPTIKGVDIVGWEQSLEVWAKILEVANKVDEIEKIWWLQEAFWLYSTKIWATRIASLDKARAAANDNDLAIIETDIQKKAA